MTWDMQNKVETQNLGGAGRGVLAPIVMKARADVDLTKPENWEYSDGLPTPVADSELPDLSTYDPMTYYDAIGGTDKVNGNTWEKVDYMGVPFHHYRYVTNNNGNIVNRLAEFGWLEGNIVRITDPNNELYDPNAVCYIYLRSTAGTSDYANVMKVVKKDGKMVTALGFVKVGKEGDIITLTFEGTCKEDFSMSKDVVVNPAGTEQMDIEFYDVMLGDSNDDYEIDIRDLVRVSKQLVEPPQDTNNHNSDCDRDNVIEDTDRESIVDYLCEIIDQFAR